MPSDGQNPDFYNVQVEIYADTAFDTLIDIINARREPSILSEIKGHGAGSFKVSKSDPKIMNNPNLLNYRNYVKLRLNGEVIGGFIIQTKKTIIVGAGEERDEMWEISGEGPRSWSKDASVYPYGGLKSSSAEDRHFNFSTEIGSWYDSTKWRWASTRWYQDHVRSPKWPYPANWPHVPNSTWIAHTPYAAGVADPPGYSYYRHQFTTPGSNPDALTQYAFFIAIDDSGEVYVDGELKATLESPGYYEVTRVELELHPGPHVIGVKTYNLPAANGIAGRGPGEMLGALFTYGDPAKPTSAVIVNHTGMANTWRVNPYPAQEPGWTIGHVILTLLTEAKNRGVRFANNFTPMFTETADSAGVPWGEPVSYTFGVGTTYEEVFTSLEELGCDIWVDPDTLGLYVWNKRGTDRSIQGLPEGNAVVLTPGHNLVSADETGQAEIANTLMLRTTDGWVEKKPEDLTSNTRFGRVETQMATQMSSKGVAPLVQELFRQKSLPEVSATFEIVPIPGSIPFMDFNVGDWISAPGEVPGVKEKRRVMSIAFTEDLTTGRPIYALEFDTIFKDRQSELERWVSRLSNSSAIGGGFSNSSNLPPTSIIVPPGTPISPNPDPPTGLVVSSVGHYQEDGASSSDYGLTWNAVTTGFGFGSVDIAQYEVWGRLTSDTESSLLTTVFDTMAYLKGFRPGDEWAFKVRAISRDGGPGEFSDEVALVAEPPLAPLNTPSAPILSTGFGTVTVKWDGLLGGNPAPPYVRYIRVERSGDAEVTWEPVGTLVSFSMNDRPGSAGETYSYRFVAVDGYGNESLPSSTTSIEVQGINSGDITGGLASNNLVANGSFEDGLEPFWEKISGHPTSVAEIASGAGSLSGSKYLKLTRAVEPPVEDAELVYLTVAQGRNFYIPISPVGGYGYFLSAKVRSEAPVEESFTIRAYWYTEDGETPAESVFSEAVSFADLTSEARYVTGQVFPPEDAKFMRIAVVSAIADTVLHVDDVVAREAVTSDMIGEGAIVAAHMSAGSVTANALQAESVTAEAIAAGAIQADSIAAGAIQVDHISPSVGESLDISSNSSINILINRTEVIEGELEDTSEAVASLTTYYSFGPEGAIIGRNDSAFKLYLKNDRIEIQENDNVVSYWDSGRMVVPSFVGEEVVLGNHQLVKYGSGTVVRAI